MKLQGLLQFRTEAAVAALNALNIGGAFLLQLVILGVIGPSGETDAYFASAAIPQVIMAISASTATGAIVPLLSHRRRDEQSSIALIIMAVVGVSVGVVSLLLWLSAGRWVHYIFPGFQGDMYALSVELIRISLITAPFVALSAILVAFHQARGHFIKIETINVSLTTIVLALLWVALPVFGVVAAAWLVLGRFIFQCALLSFGVKLHPSPGMMADAREAGRRARALIAGGLYFKSDMLVDRHLLSMAAAGSLTGVSFAQAIFVAISGVLGQALASTALPGLSRSAKGDDWPTFHRIFNRNLAVILALSVTAFVALTALAMAFGDLLFGGPGSESDVTLWVVMLALGGVPIFGGAGALVAGGFYARGDTRTPTVVSAITFTFAIGLKFALFEEFGLYAVCLLTSTFYAANMTLLFCILKFGDRKKV